MPGSRRPDPAAPFAALDRDYLPHLSVDGVIVGARAGELTVLLMRGVEGDVWRLPGGYVRWDESLDQAAARMLAERTGLAGAYLRQFHTFGAADRGDAAPAAFRTLGVEPPAGHWTVGRVVSVGYVALVDRAEARVTPDALTHEYGWWDAAARPRLVLDHAEMIERALAALRAQLDTLPLGRTLLPGAFTMPELQRLYETVLGRPLDRRNFQKRVRDLGLVERLPGQRPSRVSRPTYLYRWAGDAAGNAGGTTHPA